MIACGDSGVHGKVTTPLKTSLPDEALGIDLSTANKQQQQKSPISEEVVGRAP